MATYNTSVGPQQVGQERIDVSIETKKCPTCNAKPFQRCIRQGKGGGKEMVGVHPDRLVDPLRYTKDGGSDVRVIDAMLARGFRVFQILKLTAYTEDEVYAAMARIGMEKAG